MPKILERFVQNLKARGYSESNAYAIATSALQKEGLMKKGSQKLTAKGRAKK